MMIRLLCVLICAGSLLSCARESEPVAQAPANPVIEVPNEFLDRQAEFDYAMNLLNGTAVSAVENSREQCIDACIAAATAMLEVVQVRLDPNDAATVVATCVLTRANDLYIETRVDGCGRDLEEIYRQCTKILARTIDTHVQLTPTSAHHTR